MHDCCFGSGGKWNWNPFLRSRFSHRHFHFTSSSQACLLRRKPHRTLLSSVAHRCCYFSTTTRLLRASWNRYVRISYYSYNRGCRLSVVVMTFIWSHLRSYSTSSPVSFRWGNHPWRANYLGSSNIFHLLRRRHNVTYTLTTIHMSNATLWGWVIVIYNAN